MILLKNPPFSSLVPFRGAGPILFLSCLGTFFASTQATGAQELPGSGPVLDRQEVDLGQRSIIYDRIAPPVLKSAPVKESVSEPAGRAPMSEELAEARRWEALGHVTLNLSCTVVEGSGWTELRWRNGNQEVVAWSTFPFKTLEGILDFSTEETAYTLMLTVQEITPAEVSAGNAEVRRRALDPGLLVSIPSIAGNAAAGSGRSSCRFVAPEQVPPEMRLAMEDLHRYADTHREQIARAYQEREAVRLAREKELRENPPQPRDTIIRYFPIRSQNPSAAGTNQENP